MNRRLWCAAMSGIVLLAGCSRQEPITLRIMTYNVHHGAGMDDAIDLERIAAVIRTHDPDLVSLQEVDRGVERTARVDQPEELARLTGMNVVFERNIEHQGGDYGNAVLTRHPVVSCHNHPLPQLRPGEQRGLLEVVVIVAGNRLTFFSTHFDYRPDDAERWASVAMLEELLLDQDRGTVILAGDLNDMPGSRVIERITASLHDSHGPGPGTGFTYPADDPRRRIDYILYRSREELACIREQVIDEPVASDHRPCLATFTWHPR